MLGICREVTIRAMSLPPSPTPLHINSDPAVAVASVLDSQQFRAALGMFATGVTIVTARGEDGTLVGLTANSFNSVSLTPPLVLWSLGKRAGSMPVFSRGSHYAINILAADQKDLAQRLPRGTSTALPACGGEKAAAVHRCWRDARRCLNAPTAVSMKRATTSSSWEKWKPARGWSRPSR